MEEIERRLVGAIRRRIYPFCQVGDNRPKKHGERSGGAIRIDLYDSRKLYNDRAIGSAVSSGAIEMGYVNLSRYAETIPVVGPFELPFVFNSLTVVSAFLDRAGQPGQELMEALYGRQRSGACCEQTALLGTISRAP